MLTDAPDLAAWDPAPETLPFLPDPATDTPLGRIDRPDPLELLSRAEPDVPQEIVLLPPPEPDPPARSDPPPKTPETATAKADQHPMPKKVVTKAEKKPSSEKAKPASVKASESRKAETAAGNGKSDAAGTGGNAEAATLSQSNVNDLKASWGAKIRARIERRKEYPAKADGASGKVTLALVIGRDGRLVSAKVLRSSGHKVLDQAALKAVGRAGPFPAAPKGLTEGSYAFALSIDFKK